MQDNYWWQYDIKRLGNTDELSPVSLEDTAGYHP